MTSDKSAEEIVRGRIDAIKARCEAATPGPWQDCRDYAAMVLAEDEQQRICDIRGWGHLTAVLGLSEDAAYERQLDDAAFIAHAREDIPYLLERVAELEAQLTASQQETRAAVEDIEFMMRHSGERGVCKLCTHNCTINRRVKPECCFANWRGPQEA